MKIKLSTKQIEELGRELKETDRKDFDVTDVAEVFRMLRHWARSVGDGREKIKTLAQRPDGYICRVNQTFQASMKLYLKEVRARHKSEKIEQMVQRTKEKKVRDAMEEYDRLIKEAEEKKERSRRSG